jgi:nucleotide-binding universal stress UspA family protein
MTSPSAKSLHILLAVDGSEHAYQAARLLRTLPCFPNCTLTAMMVVVPHLTSFNYYIDSVLEKTQELLSDGPGPKVRTLKIFGANPAEQINKFAAERHMDLIVIGAQGLRSTLGILLGGTAQQVVEYAGCPVLVVRAQSRRLQRVLLVTDGSEHSQMARNFLARFKLPEGAQIEVCHVLPPGLVPDRVSQAWEQVGSERLVATPPDVLAALNRQLEEDETRGKAILAEATTGLRQTGAPVAEGVLLRGDAATEIMQYIQDHQIDLVVAGSRGLSRVEGWWLGSVSRKLVHYAPCSSLIVRGVLDG